MAVDYTLAAAAPARFEKPLRVFITVAFFCLCGTIVWFLGITPFKPFSRIEITGYSGMDRDLILSKAGITSGISYFTADSGAMEKALMGLGIFESAAVFKYYPSRLQIILEDRRAVAQALASRDGGIVPVLLDRQGVVFGIGEASMALSGMLPVISGLAIDDPFPGMKLPAVFISLFAGLEKIMISAPELLGAVSELRINRKLFDDFDLILYPVYKKIKVRLPELNEDLLRYTLLMVDVLASHEGSVETLDFRSGIASYIPKEAASE